MNPLYEKLFVLQTSYNRHTNITRISSKEDYYLKHIQDSLALLPFLDIPRGVSTTRLIDIGTGGGYPGIPLAIERPDIQVTLNDATQKKIRYVQSVIQELPLPHAEAVWGRAEVLGRQKKYHAQYDFVTARAVAPLKDLLELASPFLRKGGRALLMKARNVDAELADARRSAAQHKLVLADVRRHRLAEMDRAIVVYVKTA